MIVKLFDKTELSVTEDQAHKIKSAIAAGAKHLEIDETWVNVSNIASIVPEDKFNFFEYGDYVLDRKNAEQRSDRLIGDWADHRGEVSPTKELIKSKLKAGKTWPEIAREI